LISNVIASALRTTCY